jgi:hypothetical protein
MLERPDYSNVFEARRAMRRQTGVRLRRVEYGVVIAELPTAQGATGLG